MRNPNASDYFYMGLLSSDVYLFSSLPLYGAFDHVTHKNYGTGGDRLKSAVKSASFRDGKTDGK